MIDWVIIAFALSASALCIWRFDKTGIVIVALGGWLLGIAADHFGLTHIDPAVGSLKDVWLRYGLVEMLGIALAIFIVKRLYIKLRSQRITPPL